MCCNCGNLMQKLGCGNLTNIIFSLIFPDDEKGENYDEEFSEGNEQAGEKG